MKLKFWFIVVIAIIVCFSNAGYTFEKTATTAATFLKIGVGARAMALGESYVARANDVSALYWNPAGISHLSQPSFQVGHNVWVSDLAHDFVGLTLPFSGGVVGISGVFLNTDEIEITTIYEQDGSGLYYDAADMALGITYGRFLTDRFAVGVTGRYIQQTLYHESAQTIAIDIGTQLKTSFWGATLGMSISNFGGKMTLSGSDLIISGNLDSNIGDRRVDTRLKTEPWPLPLAFRVGLALEAIGPMSDLIVNDANQLTLSLDGLHPNDGNERWGWGIEYNWRRLLALRTGYHFGTDERGWACGGGINLAIKPFPMSVDYAYGDFGILEGVHSISFGFFF